MLNKKWVSAFISLLFLASVSLENFRTQLAFYLGYPVAPFPQLVLWLVAVNHKIRLALIVLGGRIFIAVVIAFIIRFKLRSTLRPEIFLLCSEYLLVSVSISGLSSV